MNRKFTIAVAAMAVVLGYGIVRASEKPTPEYVAAMKGINAAAGPLRAHLTAKDFDGMVADVAALKPHAEVSAKFWAEKKAEPGTKIAADVVKALADLDTAAKAKNDDAAQAAGKVITGSCMGCHSAHRERTPEGAYLIK